MSDRRKRFWALLGILVFLLLNYPLLQIFNRDLMLGGIPVLILYLHGVWLLAILALAALGKQLASRE